MLVLLQPTSPLRDEADIDHAIELFEKTGTSVASVSQIDSFNPFLIRTIDNNMSLVKLINENSTIRRQSLKKYYRVNGAIYVNKVSDLSNSTSFNDNEIGYVMDSLKSVDVDDISDLKFARKATRKL